MTILHDYSLFFYGSLRASEVRRAVLGSDIRPEQMQDGNLNGYEPRCVVGAHYPMLVAQKTGLCVGLLVRELSIQSVTVLDAFEGAHYRRAPVEVNISGGTTIAEVYLPDNTLTAGPIWHYDAWRLHGMASFFSDDFECSGIKTPFSEGDKG